MASSNFVDYVKVFCRSGKGGGGSVHFYRGRAIPFGGPDGGNGARGGHVIIRGNSQLWTLLHLKYTKHIYAQDGGSGKGANQTGAEGQDFYIDVPLGTVVRDAETGLVDLEITKHGEEKILMAGGRGGKGNTHFKSATMQAPKFSQPGEDAIEGWKIIELKILADVALVGFPNAGKSTLLSVVSEAKPEIADYPFTTLTPNLGMVSYREKRSFIMADIPGIIEGAHEGRGLGLRFLRHIERNSVLLFMVPVDAEDIKKDYNILLNELKMYNPELLDKPRLLAITKCDLVEEDVLKKLARKLPKIPHIFISAHTNKNILKLKDLIWETINQPEENQ
ncbi:MAG: GTPase ObgE [Bacteroidetes bacterium]|nr:GTPase ObgE [Bacteroidota bacterium]